MQFIYLIFGLLFVSIYSYEINDNDVANNDANARKYGVSTWVLESGFLNQKEALIFFLNKKIDVGAE